MTMNKIDIRCPFCGATHSVLVNDASFLRWQGGVLIQDAMPELSPTEREQLISGLCPTCQADIFGGEDEPSDEDFEDYGDLEMGFDPYLGCYTDDC